jgi:hypothetical protein
MSRPVTLPIFQPPPALRPRFPATRSQSTRPYQTLRDNPGLHYLAQRGAGSLTKHRAGVDLPPPGIFLQLVMHKVYFSRLIALRRVLLRRGAKPLQRNRLSQSS